MGLGNKRVRKVSPKHPVEMLREDFMPDFKLTAASLASALGVSRQTINELLRERRSITLVIALRLSRLFGNTPEFWVNAQRAYDLWHAQENSRDDLEKIKPLNTD